MALPDAVVSTLFGIFDVMNAFASHGHPERRFGRAAPFHVEIVGEAVGPLELASGVPINVQRAIDTIETTDIVIVPSVLLRPDGWQKGRYPRLVDWLRTMHERGAVLCSACSGIFLLAETGLFDGKDATVHFGYARAFAATYPAVPIHPERVLVISGCARRAGQLGRLDELARPGALPHRALRRRDRRAGSRAHVRAAMASGRAHALHRVRRQERPRRRRDPERAAVAEPATSRSPTRWRR